MSHNLSDVIYLKRFDSFKESLVFLSALLLTRLLIGLFNSLLLSLAAL